ncbi:nucleoside hydrolase [Membranihabitans marinus]|uniref:nucleoside hydrolase n=1 Tax=Membranihabitans marinus TaxID=1227546 RepID=UPI001F3998FF|nr:nucleoside hydrolase [Membranihabitans marinus]
MHKIIYLILFVSLVLGGYSLYCKSMSVFSSDESNREVVLILDTDIDSDVDDVGTLAMLHTLADEKIVKILGIVVTSDDVYAAQCVDAINHFYSRPDIPIGVEKDIELRHHSKYTKEISEEFDSDLGVGQKLEDATRLYRRLLTEQKDGAVVVVTVGHLTNLKNLLESKPDDISPLSGLELVERKVKLWSCMGGRFPEGKEANFYRPDPQSTVVCVENWSGPVVFAGWEIGNDIITGGEYLKSSLPIHHPVRRGYQLYNDFQGRQSWDQAALLYAVFPTSPYWSIEDKGLCLVAADGSNRWEKGLMRNHGYLIPRMPVDKISQKLDELMVGVYKADDN